MVKAITKFEAKDLASADPFEKILKDLEKETPHEPGCLLYEVLRVKRAPPQYYILEYWGTEDDLKNHAQAVSDRHLIELVMPLINGAIETEVIENLNTK